MVEKPKIESQPEEEKKQEEFDKFMVPEDWVEDITEAQKQAYRIKAMAYSYKRARGFEKIIPKEYGGSHDYKKYEVGETDQPISLDYKWAEEQYPYIYGEEERYPDKIGKAIDMVFDSMARAYIELRARMLARSDRNQEKRNQEKK